MFAGLNRERDDFKPGIPPTTGGGEFNVPGVAPELIPAETGEAGL